MSIFSAPWPNKVRFPPVVRDALCPYFGKLRNGGSVFFVNSIHPIHFVVVRVVHFGHTYPVEIWSDILNLFTTGHLLLINKMTCGCAQCRKVSKSTRRRVASVSPSILYLLSPTKPPKKRYDTAPAKRRVRRRRKTGKFIKNKKVTKVKRKKIIGQKRKKR